MSVLFCSDLHLGHDLASEKRGFKSVADHDSSILNTLINQCNKRTILYVLGDACMKKGNLDSFVAIPGRKILVRGNHDNYKSEDYLKYFEEIHGFIKYKKFWLSHCPIHPQEMYRCELNIHGHIHKNTNSPNLDHPYFNVNWDFWGRAISLDEIRGLLNERR